MLTNLQFHVWDELPFNAFSDWLAVRATDLGMKSAKFAKSA